MPPLVSSACHELQTRLKEERANPRVAAAAKCRLGWRVEGVVGPAWCLPGCLTRAHGTLGCPWGETQRQWSSPFAVGADRETEAHGLIFAAARGRWLLSLQMRKLRLREAKRP